MAGGEGSQWHMLRGVRYICAREDQSVINHSPLSSYGVPPRKPSNTQGLVKGQFYIPHRFEALQITSRISNGPILYYRFEALQITHV